MNDTDPLWTSVYTNVYTSPHLQIPWYSILGNHDYIYNAEAQIDYYKNKWDSRWTMPDHVYNVIYPIGGSYEGAPSTASLEIIFIDTCMLAPTVFGEDITPKQRDDALTKVESLLAASTATWLFVAGHYTIYSTAEHGNTKELVQSLVPLLKKYKVQAYFNGHDHVLQHISMDGVEYITSGRGALTDNYPANEVDHPITNDKEVLKYLSLSIGFNSATVTSDSVSIRFHSGVKGGAVDYTFQLLNPRTSQIANDDSEQTMRQERRKHVLRAVIIGVVCLIVGLVGGVFAPTSLRVTITKCCCGGYFKFCERKLSGTSLNTMVPVSEPTSSTDGKSRVDSSEAVSSRMVKLLKGAMSGSSSSMNAYGRVDSSEHGSNRDLEMNSL